MSNIRAALVKGRSGGDPVYLAADDTAIDLKEGIGQICTAQTQSAFGMGISPARVNPGNNFYPKISFNNVVRSHLSILFAF